MLQLVYMWIEDFRTLKDVNLNFHSNFEFEFKKDDNNENQGILKIKKFNPNDEFIYKYFPDKQFISLIVGKNGTGKSSVLELLELIENNTMYYVPHIGEKKYHLENKFFCIFLDKDNNKLFLWGAIIHKKDKSKIRFVEFEEISEVKEFTLRLPPKEVFSQESKTDLEKTYFSLDDYKVQIHLIDKEFKKWWQKPLIGASWGEAFESTYLKGNESFVKNLFKCKNINIISEIISIDKYAKLPDYFIITVPYGNLTKDKKSYDFEKFLKEIKDSKLPEDRKKLIENSIRKLETFRKIIFGKKLEPILRIKAILFIHAFLRYINNMVEVYEGWKDFIESKEFEKLFEKLETISELGNNAKIKNLIKDVYEHYKSIELRIGGIIYTSIINESLGKIEQFLSSLEKLIEDREKVEQKEFNGLILIEMEIDKFKNDNSFLKKVADLVDKYLALRLYEFNPIKLDFRPLLSSGQKALLSVFADISEVLDGENCSQKDTEENVILLLDEPDVYFHPEWQRLFIYFFTEFLKKKYSDKDFHVIISTHSPFMLSDIPKGNCVFLDLHKEGENGKN